MQSGSMPGWCWLDSSCGWDAPTAQSAGRALLMGALGLCPAGGAELWAPQCGTLAHVLPNHPAVWHCSAASPLALVEGKRLQGPLLQALEQLNSLDMHSLFELEQVQEELQGLSGNRQYIFWGRFFWLRKAKPENGCVTLEICLKNKLQGKFCKIDVGTSNGHELAMNKFRLEVKFLTVRRIKLLDNIPIAEAREEFKRNYFKKLSEMGLVASLSLYREAP